MPRVAHSITLSSSLAGRRPAREPVREPASDLDSVMEFGKFHYAIQFASQLASWSATCFRLNSISLSRSQTWLQTWFPMCCRQVRAISTCRDSSNLVDRFRPYSITLCCSQKSVSIWQSYWQNRVVPISGHGIYV